MAHPLSEEEAQQAANEVARQFGRLECDRCVMVIARRLGKEFPATFERLRTSDKSDVIGLIAEDVQVSRNRTHAGVRVGDRIFDNIHQQGVPAAEWSGKFMTATGAPLDQDSAPIGDFFGRGFLTKKFLRWLFGW